jgi:hypothetical protein
MAGSGGTSPSQCVQPVRSVHPMEARVLRWTRLRPSRCVPLYSSRLLAVLLVMTPAMVAELLQAVIKLEEYSVSPSDPAAIQ